MKYKIIASIFVLLVLVILYLVFSGPDEAEPGAINTTNPVELPQ